MLGNVNNIFPL